MRLQSLFNNQIYDIIPPSPSSPHHLSPPLPISLLLPLPSPSSPHLCMELEAYMFVMVRDHCDLRSAELIEVGRQHCLQGNMILAL